MKKGSDSSRMLQEQEKVAPEIARCSSGCAGLDDVLGGGLPVGHVYLVEGEPGTGKTTLAIQFVAEGLRRGEKVLYVTLSESRVEIMTVARLHGLRLMASPFSKSGQVSKTLSQKDNIPYSIPPKSN